jgi:hypothetical protein
MHVINISYIIASCHVFYVKEILHDIVVIEKEVHVCLSKFISHETY